MEKGPGIMPGSITDSLCEETNLGFLICKMGVGRIDKIISKVHTNIKILG